MAQLAHPNVVAVHDVGLHHGAIFVAMEYVEGETLARWLATPRRPRAILEAFAAAGAGLAAAHTAGLVHRDFKPENVLVGRDGRVRVGDFGLVRTVSRGGAAPDPDEPRDPDDPSDPDAPLGDRLAPAPRVAQAKPDLTASGAVMGTPLYMAPEQHRGEEADARSDQFSFCVALFVALYGARPFDGDSFEALGSAVLAGKLNSPPHGWSPLSPPPPSRWSASCWRCARGARRRARAPRSSCEASGIRLARRRSRRRWRGPGCPTPRPAPARSSGSAMPTRPGGSRCTPAPARRRACEARSPRPCSACA